MKRPILILFLFLKLTAATTSYAQTTPPPIKTWNINGETRNAMVYIPKTATQRATPIIFAFHGRGGTMEKAYQQRNFEKLWPEAIIVYPQGLGIPGTLTTVKREMTGWIMNDTTNNNIDLQFFDAMLKTLQKDYNIDHNRIYVTGHSNGGAFTYMLWATRGNELAAFAPTATTVGKLGNKLKPKPMLHAIGEKDPAATPALKKYTYDAILSLNQCDTVGKNIGKFATLYHSKTGNDVVLYIHKAGHIYPSDVNKYIIDFFKKYTLKK